MQVDGYHTTPDEWPIIFLAELFGIGISALTVRSSVVFDSVAPAKLTLYFKRVFFNASKISFVKDLCASKIFYYLCKRILTYM